jgi:anion-transporting  ArsA/GET3 family ATPase
LQHIIIVTGKGGVGKSFVASLLAKKLALEGKKTLLVDMVPESYLAKSLNLASPPNGLLAQKTQFGFDWSLWLGEACLAEYVQYWVRLSWLSQAFLKNNWLKSLIHLAPGLREIAFLGKLTSQVRRHGPMMNYDHIVVDAVSTGHFLSLVKTPQGLSESVSSGPMHEQTKQIQKVLNDPQKTKILVVTNLERYSLSETKELHDQFKLALHAEVALVANKHFQIPSDLEAIDTKMPPDLQSFLQAQKEILNYQKQAIHTLQEISPNIFLVPFYYTQVTDILGNNDEIRKLFKTT